jgi:hydroxymethylbilane synthase
MTTQGDRDRSTPLPSIGGKGLFTAELEDAIRNGEIDFAVHSLKDLPTEEPDRLIVGAIPARAETRDALVSRTGVTFAGLPRGAAVGTSSLRRAAQLRHRRPDLRLLDIRGNVDTRIKKALDPEGPYDAIVLAEAGMARLGLDARRSSLEEVMLPAPGQGALGIQCRSDDESRRLLAPLNDLHAAMAATAERAFLSGLGGGCSVPVAALGRITERKLVLHGRVDSPDGSEEVDVMLEDEPTMVGAMRAGEKLARLALERGAARLIAVHQ